MVKFMLYPSFFTLALAQLTTIYKSQGTSLYLFDIVVAITAVFYFLYLLAVKKTFKVPKAFIYIFAFICVGMLSLFVNAVNYRTSELISASLYAVRVCSYILLALGIYNLIKTNLLIQDDLYTALIASGLMVGIIGVIQLIIFPDFGLIDPSHGWDPHKNRLASSFLDPNFVGAYLTMILTILLVNNRLKLSLGSLAIALFLMICIILTFSRSSWLMLAIVILVYGLVKSPKLLFVAIITGFLAYYTVPRIQTRISGTTDPSDSAHFRLISWSNTWEIISDNWIWGVGFNALRPVQRDYGFADEDTIGGHALSGSDSSLLFVWATSGVIGLLLFLSGLLYGLKLKNDGDNVYVLLLPALLVQSCFVNALFYPQIMSIWLVLLATTESSSK
jgi:O-antigen ligase